MVKHVWSIICQESITNEDNKSLSLINILEGLRVDVAKDAPKGVDINVPIKYEVISLFRKDKRGSEEAISQRLSMIGPGGVVLSEPVVSNVVMKKGKFNHRQRVRVFGLKLTSSGEYNIQVELKEKGETSYKIVSRVPLEVTISKKNK